MVVRRWVCSPSTMYWASSRNFPHSHTAEAAQQQLHCATETTLPVLECLCFQLFSLPTLPGVLFAPMVMARPAVTWPTPAADGRRLVANDTPQERGGNPWVAYEGKN